MLFLLDPAATYLSMTVRHGRGASGHWPFLPLPAFSSSASLLPPLAALGSAVSPAHCAGLPAWKIHRSQSHRKKAPLGCFLSVDPAATYLSMAVRLRCPSSATGSGQLRCVASTLCWLTDMENTSFPKPQKKSTLRVLSFCGSGSYLSFHAVASTVFSAYKGLTSVFGMGTGGSP